MPHTHSELVKHAARWLQTRRNSVVITELATHDEEPDAIGWRGWHSTLIECKASVADFRADRRKLFRQHAERGVGQQRFYCTPPGLIAIEDLPQGWGLLECQSDGRMRVRRKSSLFRKCNSRHEVEILLSALKRTGQTCQSGISIRPYTFETKNRATLGVEKQHEALEQ